MKIGALQRELGGSGGTVGPPARQRVRQYPLLAAQVQGSHPVVVPHCVLSLSYGSRNRIIDGGPQRVLRLFHLLFALSHPLVPCLIDKKLELRGFSLPLTLIRHVVQVVSALRNPVAADRGYVGGLIVIVSLGNGSRNDGLGFAAVEVLELFLLV